MIISFLISEIIILLAHFAFLVIGLILMPPETQAESEQQIFYSNLAFFFEILGFFGSAICRSLLMKRYGTVDRDTQWGSIEMKTKFKLVFGAKNLDSEDMEVIARNRRQLTGELKDSTDSLLDESQRLDSKRERYNKYRKEMTDKYLDDIMKAMISVSNNFCE